jgi:hypothetical protein
MREDEEGNIYRAKETNAKALEQTVHSFAFPFAAYFAVRKRAAKAAE